MLTKRARVDEEAGWTKAVFLPFVYRSTAVILVHPMVICVVDSVVVLIAMTPLLRDFPNLVRFECRRSPVVSNFPNDFVFPLT